MTTPKPPIFFAGLGAMGGGMATNLVKNGFHVTGHDVYAPLLEKFTQAGGHSAESPQKGISTVPVVISMVANAAQNASFLFDGDDAVAKNFATNATFILCSTTAPSFPIEIRKRLNEEFGRSDVRVLDCPVSGGTFRAADGSLSIFASGPEGDVENVQGVLECMSGNLYRMGTELGQGQKTKAIHQLLAATNILSASEAMGFAATAGLNTREVVEFVDRSDAASFMFTNRAPHMLSNDWSALSALGIILKDTGIVTDVARSANYPSPLANTAHDGYLAGVEAGLLRDDDAKLVHLYLPPASSDLVYRLSAPGAGAAEGREGVVKEDIADLLGGIHLAASIEAMGMCAALSQDRKVMCEIISKAAGWNAMFTRCVPQMLEKDVWSLAECEEAKVVGERLAYAVDKCRRLRFPCPMAAVALARFQFAGLRS